MEDQTIEHRPITREIALVQNVTTEDVWNWLSKGWHDFRCSWLIGMTYSAGFVIIGLFVSFGFYYYDLPQLILPSLTGFLLVGPAVGVGYYEISRRLQNDEPITFLSTLAGYKRNTLGIMGLGICLVFLLQIWIRLSFTVFALSFPGVMPEWSDIFARFLTMEGVYFAISTTCLGAVFATLVFFGAAFAMPLMVGRKSVLISSMITSAYAVYRNPAAMILWAAIIVIATGIGILTAFIGLIITLPLIGHATWHSYQQVFQGELAPEVHDE